MVEGDHAKGRKFHKSFGGEMRNVEKRLIRGGVAEKFLSFLAGKKCDFENGLVTTIIQIQNV